MIVVLFCSPLFMPLLYLGVIQVSTKKIIYLIFSVITLQSIFNASNHALVIKGNRTHADRITNDCPLDNLALEIRDIPQVIIVEVHIEGRDSEQSCNHQKLFHYSATPLATRAVPVYDEEPYRTTLPALIKSAAAS